MVRESEAESTGAERRRHPRIDLAAAILVSPNGNPLVSPNGNPHETTVFDMSESGARIGMPDHFEFDTGALVRLYFQRDYGQAVLFAEIKRMAIDHLGVEFIDGQRELVAQLIDELSEAA
jgi:hypothetical protein